MKALVLQEPHRLTIEDRPIPEPGPGEVRVRIHRGGICGSDMHYFHHGGFGVVRMKAPMVLGHELAGVVDATGAGVTAVTEGDRVAVNPSLACGACAYCRAGMPRQCSDMRFMGSAMRDPHVDGGFREYVVVTEQQAVPVGDGIGLDEAAVCEPLAVCLHAVSQGPDLSGKRVLVTGFGPIGALTLLAARHAGAASVSATDVAAGPLALAGQLGAAASYDVSVPGALAEEEKDRGRFDVVFECSGHPSAVQSALAVTRPGGSIVQVGILPDQMTLPFNPLVTKEITYRGTFRFDREFNQAAALISSRAIDVRPIISGTFPFTEADAAFAFAQDRQRAIKVMLEFA
ncbi:L-idonate 5-dehydrogenase [Devosia sp.]|uniref:L-idonate 5-dehydrogenase n=1 Tax=Devosia sp. TaxID=1871048 RepID=UPI002AFEB7A5|nr:L-idonate 5-dehydrogenase [Devosia sp.]